MKTWINVLRSEWLKMRKSNIWLLVFVSPLLASLIGIGESSGEAGPQWEYTYAMMSMLHAMLFLPLLTGVFAAFVCRYEHAGGGWKQLLALPVSRTSLYMAKFTIVLALLAVTQLLFVAGLLIVGKIKGFEAAIPWELILRGVFGGWVAAVPLAALQLAVSVAWASFAAPLALNVIFTLPNMLVAQSEQYGPYYPWAQPMLSMLLPPEGGFGAFNVPLETLVFVIAGSFALFFAAGLSYFIRKEI
ncbi:ABC transporter permease [Paenibacillus sp. GYB004]|uniref:ABC transporter permease n=1 Tax=Paenibacillus sp. GYB004 TaxID=2994393 RepID=UPI002F96415D